LLLKLRRGGMIYRKPPIDIPAQIKQLKERGLLFADETKAAHYLSNISYYRLRAYTYPFQDNRTNQHPFIKKVSFEEIIDLYVFDRKLRLLVFDALEKVEIALRTKIIYHWALGHGSHWHEEAAIYRDPNRFIRDLNKLYEEVDRSTETFIKHYKDTYTQPANPASWMSLEVASLGLLSKLFSNLRKGPEKKAVTQAFGLSKPEILESWMHCFAHIRNICAHHGRLWNRRLTTMPQIPTYTHFEFVQNTNLYPNKIYASLCCISYVLNIISPGHTFNSRLLELINSCPLADLKEMGFPHDWKSEKIWTLS
jgi:abortive infection bacteriophage resistance protein